MQNEISWHESAFVFTSGLQLKIQTAKDDRSSRKRRLEHSQLLTGNFDTVSNSPVVQVNVAFSNNPDEVVHFRLLRFVYSWPITIPFGSSSFDVSGANYSGHVCIHAPVTGYQESWWNWCCTSLYVLTAVENYLDAGRKLIGNAYVVYPDVYLNDQIQQFKHRYFSEPSIGCSDWSVRTNVPESFQSIEQQGKNYFLQPGLAFDFSDHLNRRK
jgi:hypothetical protein